MEPKHQKNTLIFILCLFFFTGSPFISGSDAGIEEEIQYVPGVLILKFAEEYTGDNQVIPDNQGGVVITGIPSVDIVCQQYNIQSMERIFPALKYTTPDLSRYFLAYFDETQNLDTVKAAFEQCPEIELVEKDIILDTFYGTTPNDTSFSNQWYLNNEDGSDINMPEAWDIQTGSPGVIIAVIDSGVDYHHPDLKDNIWINSSEFYGVEGEDDDGNGYEDDIRGWNFIHEHKENDPDDDTYGHGTHIAGIAAARTNNAVGVAGIAGGWGANPGCRIMCVKVTGKVNNSEISSISAVAKGIRYAVDNGANVINISFAVKEHNLIIEALDYTYNADTLVVAAAGNDGRDVCASEARKNDYLPSREEIIAVAATNDADIIWDDGTETGITNFGECIDVSAPGDSIYSAWPINLAPSGYVYRSGTSMAAPVVVGIAALLKSERPDWTRGKIKKAIEYTADPIDDLNPVSYKGMLGEGRVNAHAALKQTYLPAVPTNLAATPIDQTTIRLIWQDQSDNELRYKVTRNLDGVTFTLIAELEKNTTVYFDTNLSPSTQYYYKVKAVNLSGAAIAGPISATTIANPPPAAPTNLTATQTQPHAIELHWDDVANETGYEAEKMELDGEWEPLLPEPQDSTDKKDYAVEGGTTYYYRVRAKNDFGYSNWSNIASVHTKLEQPTSLVSTANCYEIKLEWQDNSSKEDGFKIERYTGSEYVVIDTVAKDVRSFWDVDLPCGQTFSYRVKAFNSLGDSAYSNGETTKTTSCSYCPYGLAMKIKPDKKEVKAGDTTTFNYEIKNKGEDIISNCRIIDQTLGEIAANFSLEPNEKKSFFKIAVVEETQTNFAYVEGKVAETEDSAKIEAHACATVKVKK